jgi:hypothetical protein
LAWRYGEIPSSAAMKRMSDTLYKPEEMEAAKAVSRRLRQTTPEEAATLGVSPGRCGGWGTRHAEVVDGANLDAMTGRPPRPARP